jgi:hypothetical protein
VKEIELNPSQQANAGPLRFFQAYGVLLVNLPTNPGTGGALGAYELHTHPDAIDRFAELVQQCRLTACLGGVHGYPALVNPANGILFATVMGTGFTLVRLPDEERKAAATSFSHVRTPPVESSLQDFGDQWITFDLFQDDKMPIRSWLNTAYAYSNELGGKSHQTATNRPVPTSPQANTSHQAKKKSRSDSNFRYKSEKEANL